MINAALKDIQPGRNAVLKGVITQEIREQFLEWKEQNGYSAHDISRLLRVNNRAVALYLEGKEGLSVSLVQNAFLAFLDNQNRLKKGIQENLLPSSFVMTSPSRELWDLLEYAHDNTCFAVGSACSGIGKTMTILAFVSADPNTVMVTADLTIRRPFKLLRVLGNLLEVPSRYDSASFLLDTIIEKLEGSRRLVVVDDAHFLSWENFEILRKIFDMAKVGVALIGQPRLYDEMRGKKGFLYDQLVSRIGMRRDLSAIKREDVRMICDELYPAGLEKRAVDFLFKKAQGQGRFRPMMNIFKLALKQHRECGDPFDLDLLMEAAKYLMI